MDSRYIVAIVVILVFYTSNWKIYQNYIYIYIYIYIKRLCFPNEVIRKININISIKIRIIKFLHIILFALNIE